MYLVTHSFTLLSEKYPPMQLLGSNGRHSAASCQQQAVLFRVTRYRERGAEEGTILYVK